MKKKTAVILGILALAVLCAVCLKPQNLEKKLKKLSRTLSSVQIEGNMELLNGDDLKSYAITSLWQKQDGQDLYKVSLTDKALNQQQLIIKNEEGVFVITPSLNQVFQFRGEWPANTPKPYLIQSMLQLLEGEYELKKEKDGMILSAPAHYTSAENLVRQEIVWNKEGKPLQLTAYDEQNTPVLKMTFTDVRYNEPLDPKAFTIPDQQKTPVGSFDYEVELPLYPMMVFDSRLSSSTVSSINGEEQHILEFSGDHDFTIVQSEKKINDQMTITEVSGQMIEGMSLIGVYDGNRLAITNSQIETSVYSQDLTPQQMMQVAESMQVAVMK